VFSVLCASENTTLGQNRPDGLSQEYPPAIAKIKQYFDQAKANGTLPDKGSITVSSKGEDVYSFPDDFYDSYENYGKNVKVRRIDEISVNGLNIDDSFLAMLAMFPNVKEISFEDCSFSSDAQYHWDRIPSLKALGISSKNQYPLTILQYAKGLKLEKLIIEVSHHQKFPDCSSLSCLSELYLTVYEDADLDGKDALEWIPPETAANVEEMSLSYTVTSQTAEALHNFKNLKSLTFHGNEYVRKMSGSEEPKKPEAARDSKKVDEVRTVETGVTDEFLARISDIPLSTLATSEGFPTITDKSVPVLLKWKSLKYIMAGKTEMSPEGIRKVYKSRRWKLFDMQPQRMDTQRMDTQQMDTQQKKSGNRRRRR
jgi:hypothetical protein